MFDKTVRIYHKKIYNLTVYPTQTKLMYPIKQNNVASSQKEVINRFVLQFIDIAVALNAL